MALNLCNNFTLLQERQTASEQQRNKQRCVSVVLPISCLMASVTAGKPTEANDYGAPVILAGHGGKAEHRELDPVRRVKNLEPCVFFLVVNNR